jgi:hypothetical protein
MDVLGQIVNRAILRHEVVGFSGEIGLEEMIVLFVIATQWRRRSSWIVD